LLFLVDIKATSLPLFSGELCVLRGISTAVLHQDLHQQDLTELLYEMVLGLSFLNHSLGTIKRTSGKTDLIEKTFTQNTRLR